MSVCYFGPANVKTSQRNKQTYALNAPAQLQTMSNQNPPINARPTGVE